MRKDQCLFCFSRKCNHRVISSDDKGKSYDEISCRRHRGDLYRHADENYKGMKTYMETTGSYCRGDKI